MSLLASSPSSVLIGILNGIATGALWGLVFVIPLFLHDFNAWQISSARYLIYGLLALVILLIRGGNAIRLLTAIEWLTLLGLSLLGNIMYYVLLVLGVQWGGSAATALIVGLLPVTVTLAGYRRSEPITLKQLLPPIVLCLLGLFAITINSVQANSHQSSSSYSSLIGLLCAFAALACWTGYSIFNRNFLLKRPDISPLDFSLLTGLTTGLLALILAIPAFLLPIWFGDTAHPSSEHKNWWLFWLTILALAMLASIIGNNCWNKASRLLPATLIGQMIIFETIFALLYSFLYAWRMPTLWEWVAITSLTCGVLWCIRSHQHIKNT